MTNRENNTEATPDSLMGSFKGNGLMPMLTFTLAVHAVVILGTSVPYLVRRASALASEELDNAARLELAVEKLKTAAQDIADEYDVTPQELGNQLGGGSRSATPAPDLMDEPDTTPVTPDEQPDRLKSSYETNLEVKVEGPTVPTFEDVDDEDDIF